MSNVQSLGVAFTKPDSSDDPYDGNPFGYRDSNLGVKLEQIIPPKYKQLPSIGDVYNLWMSSASGRSATLAALASLPVSVNGGVFQLQLGFYSWPSHPDLKYKVEVNQGWLISSLSTLQREFSVFVDDSIEVEMPHWMDQVFTRWESPTFNGVGERILPSPQITLDGRYLEFSEKVFGGLRIKGRAHGKYHRVILSIGTGTNLIRVTDINVTATASWTDEEGKLQTTSLKLQIPEDVKYILELCPQRYITQLCLKTRTLDVYFSTCTGEVIDAKLGNTSKYCTKISDNYDGNNPWLT
jgi:hypothetical protein